MALKATLFNLDLKEITLCSQNSKGVCILRSSVFPVMSWITEKIAEEPSGFNTLMITSEATACKSDLCLYCVMAVGCLYEALLVFIAYFVG